MSFLGSFLYPWVLSVCYPNRAPDNGLRVEIVWTAMERFLRLEGPKPEPQVGRPTATFVEDQVEP